MLLPIFPIRDTTSLLTLFLDSFVLRASGDFTSGDFFVGDEIFSTISSDGSSAADAESIGKLKSLIESGEVVVAFVVLSSVALLKSIGRLNLRVLLADENRSN